MFPGFLTFRSSTIDGPLVILNLLINIQSSSFESQVEASHSPVSNLDGKHLEGRPFVMSQLEKHRCE